MNIFATIIIFHITIIDKIKCSNLTDTVVFIADTEFDLRQITLVLWKRNDSVDVSEILAQYSGSVVTASIQNNTALVTEYLYPVVRVTQTIFVASGPEEFEYMAKIIKKDIIIPLRAILILTEAIEEESHVTHATNAAWENDIGDIVILTTNSEDEDVKLWTYFPYGNGKCANTTAVPLDVTSGTFYPRKFINFHGCPIRTTLLHFQPYVLLEKDNDTVTSIGGIDGETFNLVIEKLNASLDVVSSVEHGGIGTFTNGSGTGSFGDLVNGIADILTPAIMLTDLRYPKAQVSYVYETLDVYWCGPNRREIHEWAKILLPFFTDITPFIILTFVVFIIVTKFIRRYDLCHVERKRGIFFMTFVLFLGQEVNFETKCWLINSLFVMWIWFCMIVRIGYQGDLVDGLQKSILEPPLGELNEALSKVDSYGGVEVFWQYYRNTPTSEKFKILQLVEIPTTIEEIGEGKRFLLVTDILLVKWFRQSLQILDEPVSRAAVCLHSRAGWPAGPEVNLITHHIAASGLTQKIIDDFQYEWLMHNDRNDVREATPLNMATLGACFYGLLVMCSVCFVVFCGELICYKYELKSKFKRKFKVK